MALISPPVANQNGPFAVLAALIDELVVQEASAVRLIGVEHSGLESQWQLVIDEENARFQEASAQARAGRNGHLLGKSQQISEVKKVALPEVDRLELEGTAIDWTILWRIGGTTSR